MFSYFFLLLFEQVKTYAATKQRCVSLTFTVLVCLSMSIIYTIMFEIKTFQLN